MAHHIDIDMPQIPSEEYGKREDGQNRTMAFEWYCTSDERGKHWNRIAELAPRFADMGITAMWLPPPTKGTEPGSTGYDVYDLWDLGEFDQKGCVGTAYGTKEEFIGAIKKGKEHGLDSYVDGLLNHKFGADRPERFNATEVDEEDRNKEISELIEVEGWTGFDFPGRGGKYSTMKWTFDHFTGIDYDHLQDKSGIFRIHGNGTKKDWGQKIDKEFGNFDFLMGANIDYSHPEVRDDLINWGKWVIHESGAAGFRLDAVRHIDRGFISDFVNAIREVEPRLFVVGEYWKDSADTLNLYLEEIDAPFDVFDSPLHYNFKNASDEGVKCDLRKIWDKTVVQANPKNAVTLVDNHDTQIGQTLESWVAPWFKPIAYAFILLRPSGYPCVFWGDLYGCKGEKPQEPVGQLADIVKARKLFAYGELRDHWDFPNCVGWVRMGEPENGRDGCAVVVSNGKKGVKNMDVGKEHAKEKWTDILGREKDEVTIGEDGCAEFSCSARSVSIWVNNDAKGRRELGASPMP